MGRTALATIEGGITGAGLSKEDSKLLEDIAEGSLFGLAFGGAFEGAGALYKTLKIKPKVAKQIATEPLKDTSLLSRAEEVSLKSLDDDWIRGKNLDELVEDYVQTTDSPELVGMLAQHGIGKTKDVLKEFKTGYKNFKIAQKDKFVADNSRYFADPKKPTDDEIQAILTTKQAQKLLKKAVKYKLEGFGLSKKDAKLATRPLNFLLDSQYVYQMIDRNMGTELMPALSTLSRRFNIYTHVLNDVITTLKKVDKANIPDFIRDMNERYGLSGEVRSLADTEDVLKALKGRVGELTDITPQKLSELYKDKELVEASRLFSEVTDEDTFGYALSKIYDAEALSRIQIMSRELKNFRVSDLVLESDPHKNVLKYYMNFLRTKIIKDPAKKFELQAEILKGKDPLGYAYAKKHINQIVGADLGWVKRISDRSKLNHNIKRIQAGKEPRHIWAAELLDMLGSQMYPYYLGLRIDAPIRNLLQPYVLTARSGPNQTYMYKKAFEGTAYMLKTRGDDSMLRLRGFIPPKFKGEMQDILLRGIKDGAGKKLSNASDLLGDAAMKLYSASDLVNRKTTYGMALSISDDLLKGSPEALAYLKEMPRSYQNQVVRAIGLKDKEALEDVMADFLLATTQFNYNKVALSEYGRTLGSAFSAFSKWPTSILGDVVSSYHGGGSKASAKLLKKYVGPIAAAQMVELMIADAREKHPSMETLLGKNLVNWSPGMSLSPILSGEIGRSPAFTQLLRTGAGIKKGVKKIIKGDDEGFTDIRKATQILSPYNTGAYLRFALDRVPTALD